MSGTKAHGYKKGDNKAGGGGYSGAGGKRGRPQRGWEKGDVARGVAEARPNVKLPHKPGRHVERHHAEEVEAAPPDIVDRLVQTNAKLLTSLRKLDTTHDSEERSTYLQAVQRHLDLKRRIEGVLRPLLDAADLGDASAEIDDLDRAIDRGMDHLAEISPRHREFGLTVQALWGTIERRIEREREVLIPGYRRELGPGQALDLAQRLSL